MKNAVFILFLIVTNNVYAQLGSIKTFDFLNLSPSARVTALGGYAAALSDGDINMMVINPALIDSLSINQIAINHNFHLADVSHGLVSYGFLLDKLKLNVGIGVNYVSYGDFRRFDFRDNELGSFGANEIALNIAMSKTFRQRMRIGSNIKFIQSSFDTYQSNAIGLDLGLYYYKPENRTSWAFVIKNIGLQLSSYGGIKESLPLDVHIGYSKQLEHLPFRLIISAHSLNNWQLNGVDNLSSDPIFVNQEPSDRSGFANFTDNLFRHLVFGGELMIGKNGIFRLRIGYDHQRNKELSTTAFRSLSGFSFGFGVKVKKITFDYGFGSYHLAGGVNHLSMMIGLNELFNKL